VRLDNDAVHTHFEYNGGSVGARHSLLPYTLRLATRSLPGSVVERDLLESFSRMLPGAHRPRPVRATHSHSRATALRTELLRYSSKRFLLDIIPEELQEHHKVKPALLLPPSTLRTAPLTTIGRARQHLVPKPMGQKPIDLWAGWDDASPALSGGTQLGDDRDANDDDDLDLNELGL